MRQFHKIILSAFLSFVISIMFFDKSLAEKSEVVSLSLEYTTAKAAILMEQDSGQIFYEVNKDEKLQIASVTKIMTMLLIMESLDAGKIQETDIVETSEYAASMGGSQVFLEPGEKMSVKDLVKSIIVSSGNDAAVAMAEFISGREPAFVELMNKRANEIGALNTHFINCNGLDETKDHYSTAYDLALISRELLKHERLFDYTTIWMDTIREGKFGLANTNKLIKHYMGATGLKTGCTNVAQFCLSASAKRDGMHLITVILGAPSSRERFDDAKKLLDYGFANFSRVDASEFQNLDDVKIEKGMKNTVAVEIESESGFVVKKGDKGKIKKELKINRISAPIKKGDKIGQIIFAVDGQEIAILNVLSKEDVSKINFFEMLSFVTNTWLDVSGGLIIKH